MARALPFYFLLLPLLAAARVMSQRQAQRFGVLLGDLVYRAVPRYREVALRNLGRSFGWEACRSETVARQAFRNIGMTLIEFLRMPTLSSAAIRALFRVEGMDHVLAALNSGRGVILITAHYGNWELFAARMAVDGYRFHVVARDADYSATNRVINGIREACGYRVISRRSAMREILAALKRSEPVALLMDQNTIQGGVFVPFLGRPAATVSGPAQLALRTGAILIPCFAVRQADNSHVGRFLPPVPLPDTGDRATDVRELTARLTAVIEAQVRADPTQWFWIHDRWRHRPADEVPG